MRAKFLLLVICFTSLSQGACGSGGEVDTTKSTEELSEASEKSTTFTNRNCDGEACRILPGVNTCYTDGSYRHYCGAYTSGCGNDWEEWLPGYSFGNCHICRTVSQCNDDNTNLPKPPAGGSVIYNYYSDSSRTKIVGGRSVGSCGEPFEWGIRTAFFSYEILTCRDEINVAAQSPPLL